MFVEDRLAGSVGKQRLGQRLLQYRATEAAREVDDDLPVGRASPGPAIAGLMCVMQRSELVTVPSFSPQLVAGSIRSAKAAVSVLA
jgi:hypothetical protein